MSIPIQKLGETATWLGIVAQLYNTRMHALLSTHNMTLTQFSVLSYLVRNQPQKATISDIADAIEVNQPGATKIVKKFVTMDLLTVEKDSVDARKRFVSITPQGLATFGAVQRSMGPDIVQWFADWHADELDTLLGNLQKLGGWLDNNRL